MTWTDEKVTELLKLHAQGLSHSQIGRALGCGSRLEVAGKLRRIQKRKRQPGSNKGRPLSENSKPDSHDRTTWDRRTFAPYAVWKAERKKERELGLR